MAFVARNESIRNVLETTEVLADAPMRGQTFVISGAPGAGKTALLDRISEQAGVRCIHLSEAPTDNEVKHARIRLAEHFIGKPVGAFRSTRESNHSGKEGLNVLVSTNGRYTEGTSLDAADIDAFTELPISKKAWKLPVMVCIDEIQNIKN